MTNKPLTALEINARAKALAAHGAQAPAPALVPDKEWSKKYQCFMSGGYRAAYEAERESAYEDAAAYDIEERAREGAYYSHMPYAGTDSFDDWLGERLDAVADSYRCG